MTPTPESRLKWFPITTATEARVAHPDPQTFSVPPPMIWCEWCGVFWDGSIHVCRGSATK